MTCTVCAFCDWCSDIGCLQAPHFFRASAVTPRVLQSAAPRPMLRPMPVKALPVHILQSRHAVVTIFFLPTR